MSEFSKEEIDLRLKKYWVRTCRPYKATMFDNNEEKYGQFVRETYNKMKDMMFMYVEKGYGFWWEKADDYCALMQTKANKIIVPIDKYEEAMSKLLGKKFNYSQYERKEGESSADYDSRWYKLCSEVEIAFKKKHPEQYKKWSQIENEQDEELLQQL